LTQKEVAEYLGIASRTVQRYAEQGKLHCTYEPGPTGGHRPVYDREEVEKFKKQMGASENGSGASVGLSRRSPGGASPEQLEKLVEAALIRVQALPHLTVPRIRTTEKLTLTLAEAAELSGLSRGFLREAIAKKKLKGIRGAGRGFRIKRSDLETFVRGLS